MDLVLYFFRYEKKYGEELKFPQLTWRFREELLEEYGDSFIEGLYCLGRLGKQHSYPNYLGRLSIYTRTRMDYVYTISRLTPEQEEAVAAVKLKGHFTPIAIKALRRLTSGPMIMAGDPGQRGG